MRFFESVAKQIFHKEGIPILEGHVANYPEEAMAVAATYGGRLMLFNPIVWQTKPYNMEEKV